MRKAILVLIIILLGTSSCKKRTRGTMTVIKDCSGTYLRLNNKDYHVCNTESVDNFSNGTIVNATFEKLKSCPSIENQPTCYINHENEGWVKVKKIE